MVALMKARDKFSEAVAEASGGKVAVAGVTTAFTGVESGRVEAIIKSVKSTDRPYMSGTYIAERKYDLESSISQFPSCNALNSCFCLSLHIYA